MGKEVHHKIAGFNGTIDTREDTEKVVNAIVKHGGEVTAIGDSKIPVSDEKLNNQS